MDSRLLGAALVGGVAVAGFFASRMKTKPQSEKVKPIIPAREIKSEPVTANPPPTAPEEKNKETQMHRYIVIWENYNPYDFLPQLAKLFKVTEEEIQKSEIFETGMLHFIRRQDPVSLNFLNESTDITHKASYDATKEEVHICYKEFTKAQVFALAKVLEDYIPGINTVVTPYSAEATSFTLCFNKDVFINTILQHLTSKTKAFPHKISQPKEPAYREFPVPMTKTEYLTPEETEEFTVGSDARMRLQR